MCKQCDVIDSLFIASKVNPHENYYPVLHFLCALEEQKRIEVFAGDCVLKDTIDVLGTEKHYTVCHYLRCKSCGTIYFLGACIRGTPTYNKIDDIESENIHSLIWGGIGVYYKR